MSPSKPCRPVIIAHNRVARIESCPDCGCISVHVGPMSMRFTDDSLAQLFEALREAVADRKLARVADSVGRSVPRGLLS